VESQPPHPQTPVRSLPLGLLACIAATTLIITLTPLSGSIGNVALRPPTAPVEILGNLLLLSPVAATLAVASRGTFLLPVGGAAALSCAVEATQLVVPGRYLEPYDVALNTAGAALTAAAVTLLRRRGVTGAPVLIATAALTGCCVLGGLAGAAAVANRLLRVDMWDPSYPIATGDELGGGRRYVGSVTDARLCAGEPPMALCAGPGEGSDVRDSLTVLAETSHRLALSARVVSESDAQDGPTRILTFSRDTELRNATLGQSGRAVVLRVRTHLAGRNGADLAFRLPDAVRRGAPTVVAATYSPGAISLRAESAGHLVTARFPTGVLVAWRLFEPRTMGPDDLRSSAILAALAAFVPVGMALAWLLERPRLVLASTAAAVLLLVGLELLTGNSPGWLHVALAAGATVIGAALGRWDRVRLVGSRTQR